jgi:hypothetical protein
MKPKSKAPAERETAPHNKNGKGRAPGPKEGPLVPFDDLFPSRDEPLPDEPEEGPLVPMEELITDKEEPVDSRYYDIFRRMMPDALRASWAGPGPGRTFACMTDVGLFPDSRQTVLSPDVMMGVDVPIPKELRRKENRSWFVWVMGKVPDVVIEAVSNRRGGESTYKLKRYAKMGIPYYVIFDPEHWLSEETLQAFKLVKEKYQRLTRAWFPKVKLGVTLWTGTIEDVKDVWLRWCDADGAVLLTGVERAEQERQRRKRLEAKLRKLGIDPDDENDQ